MLPETQNQVWKDFYEAARENTFLEPKTTLMIHLASAMAVGCGP